MADRFQVVRVLRTEDGKVAAIQDVCDVVLEPGDELRLTVGNARRAATLIPPLTALANAISGKATVEVYEPPAPRVIATVAPKPRVIAVVKPK